MRDNSPLPRRRFLFLSPVFAACTKRSNTIARWTHRRMWALSYTTLTSDKSGPFKILFLFWTFNGNPRRDPAVQRSTVNYIERVVIIDRPTIVRALVVRYKKCRKKKCVCVNKYVWYALVASELQAVDGVFRMERARKGGHNVVFFFLGGYGNRRRVFRGFYLNDTAVGGFFFLAEKQFDVFSLPHTRIW